MLVVDNGSSETAFERLRAQLPAAVLGLRLHENQGIPGALHAGVDRLLREGPDAILIVMNDVRLDGFRGWRRRSQMGSRQGGRPSVTQGEERGMSPVAAVVRARWRVRGLVQLVGLGLVTTLAGWAAVSLPLQYVGLIAVTPVLPVLRSKSLATLGVLTVACLGLVRRLLSPGRIDYDPLLMLPILLFLLAILLGERGRGLRPRPVHIALLGLVVLPVLSQVFTGDYSVAALYAVGTQSFAFALVLAAATGSAPNIWPRLYRAALPVGLVAALYGIAQFYLLPSWDARWMMASKLASVGKPQPGLVRVFGMSESPGPYALLVGAALVVTLVTAITARTGERRLLYLAAGAPLLLALLLTGVRTALVALVVATFYASVRTGGRRGAVVLAATLAGVFALLNQLLNLVATRDSSILTSNRYSVSTLGSDQSVQARVGLLDQVVTGLSHPLGAGATIDGRVYSLDNVFIDILVRFGPIALFALVVVVIACARRVFMGPAGPPDVLVLKAVCLYFLVAALAGNPFSGTTGLLVALTLGYLIGLPEARLASPLGSRAARLGAGA